MELSSSSTQSEVSSSSTQSEVSSSIINDFQQVETCNGSTEANHKEMKSSTTESIADRITRLKSGMLKIRKDQKSIKKSQRQARNKLEKIKQNCAFIKSEAEDLTRRSERTQNRLDLIFMILEARKNKDIVKANILVGSLKLLLTKTSSAKH